eukprot:m.220419 g.220419  ORF g.220419 m.220419 type:complete len:64 (+) comp39939_c0_seq5:1743-1934(+)
MPNDFAVQRSTWLSLKKKASQRYLLFFCFSMVVCDAKNKTLPFIFWDVTPDCVLISRARLVKA